jgi:KUP system potassium uptake protein
MSRGSGGLAPAHRRGGHGSFLFVDLVVIAANATKLVEGGWFPLLLAGVIAS